MVKCENYLRYFKNYTDGFFTEVSEDSKFQLELKIVHTLNVLKLMRRLGKELNLNKEDYEIAKIIGLFHDFGRFNQIKYYGTFTDSLSINHAEESVREMQRLNILDKANDNYVPEYTKELIYKAILNHNRDKIVGENDEKLILMSKLIRDADKIDIYRAIAKDFAIVSDEQCKKTLAGLEDSDDVSDVLYEKIKKNVVLKRDDIITLQDNFVWDFYWTISDFNFPISLKVLKEKGYLKLCLDALIESGKLKYKGRVKELVDYIFEEFEKRVEKGTL